MDGGHGNINHPVPSKWMAFLRKSKKDKAYMKFKEVDFFVANTHSLVSVSEQRDDDVWIIVLHPKMDVVHLKLG